MRGRSLVSIMVISVLFSVLFCMFVDAGTGANDHEYRLTRFLMENYQPSVRPTNNSTKPLDVIFGVSLHSIIDVDEKNQILTTNCWLTQIWVDSHLVWNSSDFGGIGVIRIPYSHVWRPDVILYNNADAQYNTATINTNVIVKSDGLVTWLSHGIYRSSCDMNVEFFPFDIQECEMKWSSWTYDGYQLDLVQQMEEGDISNYNANGEFDLLAFSSEKNVEVYSCCPEPYPDITYTIKLKRRPMFYVFNLILPCLLINGIALLVFYVPSESGEKVTLGISALLSMTVFLMTIRESLPPTEKTPLISLYYGVTICLVTFASGLSVVTLNLHHRGLRGVRVSPLLRKLILGYLSKIVLLNFDGDVKFKAKSGKEDMSSKEADKFSMNESDTVEDMTAMNYFWMSPHLNQRGHMCSSNDLLHSQHTHTTSFTTSQDVTEFEHRFLHLLKLVQIAVEKNESRLEHEEKKQSIRDDWQKVSLVLDRLLLALFIIATAIASYCILFSSPHGP